jgi:hypothetical protein
MSKFDQIELPPPEVYQHQEKSKHPTYMYSVYLLAFGMLDKARQSAEQARNPKAKDYPHDHARVLENLN